MLTTLLLLFLGTKLFIVLVRSFSSVKGLIAIPSRALQIVGWTWTWTGLATGISMLFSFHEEIIIVGSRVQGSRGNTQHLSRTAGKNDQGIPLCLCL